MPCTVLEYTEKKEEEEEEEEGEEGERGTLTANMRSNHRSVDPSVCVNPDLMPPYCCELPPVCPKLDPKPDSLFLSRSGRFTDSVAGDR
ncbi:hypothetical protein Baya_15393 [Bagarius yarrelli]|uniref:Uncharacterized protein n=1 Tax=Bagarius yarrelli TaxID=175774 RepID=A0A556VBD7_BAGYA|nr:hypothetical protein Baya_15393 [Bagarius yarrelli]